MAVVQLKIPFHFPNPFRPGAGQLPPFLAGRQGEIDYFLYSAINQKPILSNLIISGLRGVGKTVLLDTLKPIAITNGWIWAGTDLSESVSVSEENLSIRIMTDLSSALASFPIYEEEVKEIGYTTKTSKEVRYIDSNMLTLIHSQTFGLEADKLKAILEFVWERIKDKASGIILAYDEAQNLTDKADDKQFPLSLLLEVITFLQKKQIPYLLILTGLPTLFSNLVEARTYSERMFHQMILNRLSDAESREAIVKPIEQDNCPVHLHADLIESIIEHSGGYPYFIQYLCKEIYDSYLQQVSMGNDERLINLEAIIRKLDTDFYLGRWNRVTDRQRELLVIISRLKNAEEEFTIKDIQEQSEISSQTFKPSPVNLLLKALTEAGIIYKNRHGKYSFAVPMFSQFIQRELVE